jgi:uncharacterized protein
MAEGNKSLVKAPLLGRLAIKNSLVTEQEFDEAMAACTSATDPEESLKSYFLANDLITPQNLKRLVTATKAVQLRQKDIKFGSIAVNKGLISQSVLDLVLEEQNHSFKTNKNPRLIGDMLVEAGIITVAHRNLILKAQNRLIKEIKRNYDISDSKLVNSTDKKPGSGDTVNPAQEGKPANASIIEMLEYGIKLEVKADGLTALISKSEEFDSSVHPDDIRDLLVKHGITFGIVNDDLFIGFVKSRGFKKKGFLAAKGIKPVKGENAKIEYFFDTDHLKAGGVSSSGRIDFKDRGVIPQVEEGTVLAEKTPVKKSSNGKTVFSQELVTSKANDIKLRYGQGAKLSEDRLKIIASVNGYPKLTWAGLVVVNKEYMTTGDVDYQTGHIKYDGNVKIKGCIKNGFEVTGNDIRAREVAGGIIHAEGNLSITNGINEATIYAKGNVYAKFVHNSNIFCMGNVYITKEIVDSKIETSGACVAKDGKIISCQITAKMGIFAKQVGTELSEPNILKTGHDIFINKEIAKIKEKITKFAKKKQKEENKKEKLLEENKNYHTTATQIANVQEKTRTNLTKLSAKLDSIVETDGKKEEIEKLKNTYSNLQKEEEVINKKLKSCFDKIDGMENQLKDFEESFSKIKQDIDDLRQEKKHLEEWNETNTGDTTIHVTGAIFPGTLVQGRFSEKQVKDRLANVKIKELMYQNNDDKKRRHQYEMIIN